MYISNARTKALIVILFVFSRPLKPLLNVQLKPLRTAKDGLHIQINCTVREGKQTQLFETKSNES